MNPYQQFIASKSQEFDSRGLAEVPPLNPQLFDFQADLVGWALRKGRAALFCDCGLGKTPMQLEWAKHVPGPVLILAPLAVAEQTVREGVKFGIPVKYLREPEDTYNKIVITNYEMLDRFDPSKFVGIVLDESSILKSYDGAFRTEIIESFARTPFRLAATATPAPNDYMELGNHAEFLGASTRTEMLSTFFVHDGGDTSKWRLKKHAQKDFWKWVCSWAVMLRKPSDLGYDDRAFILPPLTIQDVVLDVAKPLDGRLFAMPAITLQERQQARSATVEERAEAVERIIRESWTKNKSENTTAPIGSQIGIASSPIANNGTKRTLNASGNEHVSMPSPIAIENSPPSANISQLTSNSDALICENDISENATSSSRRIKHAGGTPQKGELSEIGIYEPSSDSLSENTNQSCHNRAEDARFVERSRTANRLQSTTAMPQTSTADCSAANAIPDSVNSKTDQMSSGVQPDTSKTQWVVWCGLNAEQDYLAKLLGDECVSIYGSLSPEEKVRRYDAFRNGSRAVLLTKASMFGFGVNMQFSWHQVFLGLSDSFEMFYQAVRRQWRFGQVNEVTCHIVTSSQEGAVTENIKRKEKDAAKMAEEMVNNMHELNQAAVRKAERKQKPVVKERMEASENWTMYLGDAVEIVGKIPEAMIDYSIFSPPFASLYTYSALPNDMGNCRTHAEFFEHFNFLVGELLRVTKPGRNLSFHCMNLPISKQSSGYIGIADFRGELIRTFQEKGWIYHSEVCIWKDPVTAMQRTKALGLLHKQIKKDSCMSRQGIADYLVTMRKPGENPERVTHTNETFPVSLWQKYASPVWMDINPSDTLQRESAREHEDERHICPLQLEVIRRGISLWSNPGDLVLSPFAGIGSEGYVAIQEGREFVGVELKESYFKQAVANLKTAHHKAGTLYVTEVEEAV